MNIPQDGFTQDEVQRMFALAMAAGATKLDYKTNVNTAVAAVTLSTDQIVERAEKFLVFLQKKP